MFSAPSPLPQTTCESFRFRSGEDRIRTPAENAGENAVSDQSSAESDAVGAQMAPIHPELGKVIKAWPTLPEAVRAGIVAMVEAVTEKAAE